MTNFGPFLPYIVTKMPGNCTFDLFHSVKMAPKWGKSIDHDPYVISSKGGQDKSACQILGHSSHAFWRKSRKPQIWPVSLSQNGTKMRYINKAWPKFNLFWSWSEYINMQIWDHSSLGFPRKWPEIANLACFNKSKCRQNEENQQTMTKI